MSHTSRRLIVPALVIFASCADRVAAPLSDAPVGVSYHLPGDRAASGLTISQHVVGGFYEKQSAYDWTFEKKVKAILAGDQMLPEASTTTTHLDIAETKWIEYEIDVKRSGPVVAMVSGARGSVCLTNQAGAATSALAISVIAGKSGESRKEAATVSETLVDVSAKPALSAGESYCYPYEVPFAGSPGGRFTSVVHVTTGSAEQETNDHGTAENGDDERHSEEGSAASLTDSREGRIPLTSTATRANWKAHVWDGLDVRYFESWHTGPCAELWPIFQCTSDTDDANWDFDGDGSVEYMVDEHNEFACDRSYDMTNTAILTMNGSGQPGAIRKHRGSTASVTFTTPDCKPPRPCPRSVKEWAKPDAPWPLHTTWHESLRPRPFFDSGKSWSEVITEKPHGAYARLAQQYVAATLNVITNATINREASQARDKVGHFFSLKPPLRAKVLARELATWVAVLQAYNRDGEKGCPKTED